MGSEPTPHQLGDLKSAASFPSSAAMIVSPAITRFTQFAYAWNLEGLERTFEIACRLSRRRKTYFMFLFLILVCEEIFHEAKKQRYSPRQRRRVCRIEQSLVV